MARLPQNTSARTDLLSEISEGTVIPKAKLDYFEQRALNNFYHFVLGRFDRERLSNGLTKADLARRIGKGPEQINRWLGSPGNWTIGTVAQLLIGIAGEEPNLTATSYSNRSAQNLNMETFLDISDDTEEPPQIVPPLQTRTTGVQIPIPQWDRQS